MAIVDEAMLGQIKRLEVATLNNLKSPPIHGATPDELLVAANTAILGESNFKDLYYALQEYIACKLSKNPSFDTEFDLYIPTESDDIRFVTGSVQMLARSVEINVHIIKKNHDFELKMLGIANSKS